MHVVKASRDGACAAGVVIGDEVAIVGPWVEGEPSDASFTLPSYALDDLRTAAEAASQRVPLADLRCEVPIDPRRKIICVGMNYRDHTKEIDVEVSANPVLFTRSLDSLVADGDPVVKPLVSDTFDFEGEIAIVIGIGGRHIAIADALDHVFGYACFLDGSVREYQRHSLTAGKNFWRSGAMGRRIVTRDEVEEGGLGVVTRLNGTVVQSAHASDMIFGIAEVIAYCSRFTELRPGDVIATGTPGGVGSRRTPPLWMKAGDRIEVEVAGVGTLSNPVVAEG